MKYKELDSEILTDERDFRNFKITLVLSLIAASWALKPSAESLNEYLSKSIVVSIIYLGIETLRIYLSVQHCRVCRDIFFESKKNEQRTVEEIWELDVDAGAFKTWLGNASTILYILNYFVIFLAFGLFVRGSINSVF